MVDPSIRQYTDEHFERIIRRALKMKNDNETMSHQDLIDIANEIGIESHIVDAAIEADDKQREEERIFNRRMKKRKAGYNWHMYSYIVVNCALFVTNLMVPGPWWCQWSIIGWGLGLAFHYRATLPRKIERNQYKLSWLAS